MSIETCFPYQASDKNALIRFLDTWDASYHQQIQDIPLFDPIQTSEWTTRQRQYFSKVFYHARGHFHDFLWFMGNFAPDVHNKRIVIDNIMEEFGGNRLSHEQLYLKFGECLGVDLMEEIVSQENYLTPIKAFNLGHLKWLKEHSWTGRLAAFSAYERLDNIDYVKLLELAKSLNISLLAETFFRVHTKVTHFESTIHSLLDVWRTDKDKVKEGFEFIKNHQVSMWKNLSTAVFNYQ